MKVNEIMTADVEIIRPESTIQEAAQKLKTLEVGSLPVCNGRRLVGMITDRDITIRVVAEGMDPASTRVDQVMSPDLVWCFEDETLEEAEAKMMQKQIRRLPVISRDKELVGILAVGDIAIKTDEMAKVGETMREISELPG